MKKCRNRKMKKKRLQFRARPVRAKQRRISTSAIFVAALAGFTLCAVTAFAASAASNDRCSYRKTSVQIATSFGSGNSQPDHSLACELPMTPDDESRRRKKIRRTREEIRREQQALLAKTMQEIDAIVAEFHARLPREQSQAIGGIYARYSSRFQDSIADQVRSLFEGALERKIFIPRENVFFDLAIRGGKDRRPGLNALRQAIEEKRFGVFLVFTTSRLFRRAYRAMQFAEEELVERGIRGIFLKSRLDTADGDNWRTMFQILATMDEAMVRMCGAHVQASHEGLFIRCLVWGSLCLGYTGEEIPGEFTRRKLPRRKIIIDAIAREWIEKIYRWYVDEGMSRNEIAQELNDDPAAPAPAKSLTGLWDAKLVRNHLQNPAYRGWWCYGAKKTKWSGKKDYAEQELRPEPLKSGQFEYLRIISDAQWYRAQELLAVEKGNSGRKSKDGDQQSRPRFLRGLFFCPEHGRQLVVGGPQGRILFCPLCRAIKAEKRPLFTHLNRATALRLTCHKLAELVRADDNLVNEIVTACQQSAASLQQPDPEIVGRLRSQANRLSGTITFNRRNPGETAQEQLQTEQLLKDLRRQYNELMSELTVHEAAMNTEIVIPTHQEVIALLSDLAEILTSATTAETDEQMNNARRIIDELTGGRIELFQRGERKAQRGWLQGRFHLDLVNVAFGKLTGLQVSHDESALLEVTIDYRPERLVDEQMNEAKRLWDQGLLNKVIARRMNRSTAYITMLIQRWFESQGLPCPDGRKRRKEVANKQVEEPVYKQLSDEVVDLMEQGWSNLALARRFATSDATIAKAICWWFGSRGMAVPNGKDRRDKVLRRAKALLIEGRLMKDIAAEIGYSPRGLKLALESYCAESGESLPDGRTRRGNASSGENASGQPLDDGPMS
ncbi:MAG: recombinase family protein [Planctomycetaceae bacterium]